MTLSQLPKNIATRRITDGRSSGAKSQWQRTSQGDPIRRTKLSPLNTLLVPDLISQERRLPHYSDGSS